MAEKPDQSERERRRQERLAQAQADERKERLRMVAGYAVAAVLVLAIVAGLAVAITSGDEEEVAEVPDDSHIQVQSGFLHDIEPDDRAGTPPPEVERARLDDAADTAGCELRLDLPDEGRQHIEPGDPTPDYETSPPTSGPHAGRQQADGAFAEKPSEEHTVHSLEHGRVLLQYSPDLPEAEQLELKGVFDQAPAGMLFFPNPDMRFAVATTAWQQKMVCETYEGATTLDAVRAFRDIYIGQGPEAVPIVLG